MMSMLNTLCRYTLLLLAFNRPVERELLAICKHGGKVPCPE